MYGSSFQHHTTKSCHAVPLSTAFKPYVTASVNSTEQWVKADMLATVSFNRLSLPFSGKGANGKRQYIKKIIKGHDFESIQRCMLNAVGLNHLTQHV